MMRKNAEAAGRKAGTHLHFANRNATQAGKAGAPLQIANGRGAGHHLEQACARLQDAALELEAVLSDVPGAAGRADVQEAIGSIMETMQLIAAAHARLGPSAVAAE